MVSEVVSLVLSNTYHLWVQSGIRIKVLILILLIITSYVIVIRNPSPNTSSCFIELCGCSALVSVVE